jgi:hypothetical protein
VGQVLHLEADQWRWPGGYARWVEVAGVRLDISDWYGGDWVWIEGYALDERACRTHRVQLLVACDAIPPLPPAEPQPPSRPLRRA